MRYSRRTVLKAAALTAVSHPLRGQITNAQLDPLIEKTRKGNFSITFAGDQAVIPRAEIGYQLTRLQFDLGAVFYRAHINKPESDPDRQQYLDRLNQYFNAIMLHTHWGAMEPERGHHNDEPFLAMCQWCLERGKRPLASNIFYGTVGYAEADPDEAWRTFIIPKWVRALDKEELEEAMKARLHHVLTIFDGKITDFILFNELLGPCGSVMDYYDTVLGFPTLALYFKQAKEISPKGNFYLNEYDIENGKKLPQYLQLVRSLLNAGAPVGGIGLQGHFFGDSIPSNDELWQRLDALAAFNLPIRINEFGLRATDEHQYAEDLRRFYSLCFAHPAVVGVNRWGAWDPEMWPRNASPREAPLWRKDWTPTPAGQVYEHLVTKEWTTAGSGQVDSENQLKFRGFFGSYRITVGQSHYTVELSPKKTQATIQVA